MKNEIKTYADSQVITETGSTITIVNNFRKYLRERGLLKVRQQFDNEMLNLFKQAIEHKKNSNCSWNDSFASVIGVEDTAKDTTLNSLQKEINELKFIISQQEIRMRALEIVCSKNNKM